MRFTVTAERTSRGWWALESDNGAVSQVRRLDQAAEEMREAIAYLAGIDEVEVEVEVVPTLDSQVVSDLQVVRHLREQSEQMRSAAALMSRLVASELSKGGLSVRDIGVVLGVSFQRAQQLVSAPEELRREIRESPEGARLIREAEEFISASA